METDQLTSDSFVRRLTAHDVSIPVTSQWRRLASIYLSYHDKKIIL